MMPPFLCFASISSDYRHVSRRHDAFTPQDAAAATHAVFFFTYFSPRRPPRHIFASMITPDASLSSILPILPITGCRHYAEAISCRHCQADFSPVFRSCFFTAGYRFFAFLQMLSASDEASRLMASL
jgi:hypothetical protein